MKRILISAAAAMFVTAIALAQTANKETVNAQVKEQVQNQEANKGQMQNTEAVKTQTGTKVQRGAGFVDNDGDGVCDNMATKNQAKAKKGHAYGPGDGTGNKGVGPKNGTGFGAGKGSGTGTCDGTGPKGNRGGR